MSRAGEEMILELASLLNTDTVKTAAKKDDDKDDKKPCKCGKKDCKCGCEGDSDKCKCKKEEAKKDEKKDKKASVMMGVLQNLVKLAGELDEMGAEEASGLVDDALKSIVDNLKEEPVSGSEESVVVDISPTSVDDKVIQLSQKERATLRGLLDKMGY